MARPTKYTIKLTDDERSKLKKAIKNKSTSKTVLKRYQILLVLDNDKGTALTYQQIAHSYAVCQTTISNIKRIYVDDGIDALLHNIISPNSAAALRKADGWTEAKLIQIACGPAPNGHSRWTLRLLEEKSRVELETPISRETIRRVLKKRTSPSPQRLLVYPAQRKRRIRSRNGGYPGCL